MRYRFIKEHTSQFHVESMCRVLNVSSGGFYAWLKRGASASSQKDAALSDRIADIHYKSGKTYGVRRVKEQLALEGCSCSLKKVPPADAQAVAVCPTKTKGHVVTTDSRHDLPVAENLLDRNFTVAHANEVWVSDITYIPTMEGWLYLAVVIDLHSRMVVGWSMSERIDRKLAMNALDMAIRRRSPGPGLIHHSDRGSQYASDDYQMLLRKHQMIPSMSRKGNCYDNAVAESFFSSLKTEQIYRRCYASRDEARRDIFGYIEIFYNRNRLHSTLGYLTPAQFEAAVVACAA